MSAYAIVGLSCLFPGAATPQRFWENLLGGVDSRREAGTDVFGFDPSEPTVADPEHSISTTRGGFVAAEDRPGPEQLTGFRIPAEDLAGLDDVYAWSLHVAHEAVRDAGLAVADDGLRRAGIVLGNYTFPTRTSSRLVLPLLGEAVLGGLRMVGLPVADPEPVVRPTPTDLGVGGLPALVAARALGLGGPRLALDAACSSGLYAVKLACDYLETGAADLMIAAGVCAPDPALIHLSFSDLQAYPRNGTSQPFDSSSTGILTGQGAGAVALKRLPDAVRDGDRIHAVLEGLALSNDGTGRHLLQPNPRGQLATYELAYRDAGIDPADVDYIECHATGTPLGDATELAALEQWYEGRAHQPRLGSVKGNVGHLLTVAGLTSLLKAVLAMRHGVIPPTSGVAEPLRSPSGAMGGELIVRDATAWPDRGVRRAGVSAFGFGGTNAHAVLRAPDGDLDDGPAAGSAAGPDPRSAVGGTEDPDHPVVAVTGVGLHVGGLADADALDGALRSGAADERPVPAARWYGVRDPEGDLAPSGSYLESFEVEAPRFQIPPKELGHFNEQHLLMLRVAEQALLDDGLHRPETGLRRPDRPARRVAVVIATEMEPRTHAHRARLGIGAFVAGHLDGAGLATDPEERERVLAAARSSLHDPVAPNEVLSYIGNIMASRISARWNLTGPSFTLAGDSACAATALEVAGLLLRDTTIEAVLVGGVDLAGGAESVLTHTDPADGAAPEGSPRRPGDGAAAVVLRRAADVPEERRRYPELRAVAVRHTEAGATDDADAVRGAARDALATAGLGAEEVGLLHVHDAQIAPAPSGTAGGGPEGAGGQEPWLAAVYPAGPGDPTCAVARVAAAIGDPGLAGGFAAVVAAALSVRFGYLPATRPDAGDLPADGAFYRPGPARPWLRSADGGPRVAAVALRGSLGTAAHLVLAEPARTTPDETQVRWAVAGAPVILPVEGTLEELPERLAALAAALDAGEDPTDLARSAPLGPLPAGLVRAVLVGRPAALRADLDRLVRDLPGLREKGRGNGGEWATPGGSYLTLDPIGPDARVALVYPGAFNSYLGMAQDLLQLFPGVRDRFERRAGDAEHALRARTLWPRSRTTLARRDLLTREEALLADLPAMLGTSTSQALIVTDLLRDVLGLPVTGALGYSLGESSMLRSLGAWGPDPETDARIDTTPAFVDRLCGRRRTVRELWGLGEDLPDREVWASQVLVGPADTITRAVEGFDRLFLTHVNTASEVVVQGAPDQLRTLVEQLGTAGARTPGEHVMHCPMVDPELEELARLNTYPAVDPGPVDLFTSGGYRRITSFDSAGLAGNIAQTLRSCVDFPRLVEAAYATGYRYFVEVGPGSTCTRWIHETLGDRPHAAVAVDRRGRPAATSLAHLLSRLLSHGLDLRRDVLLPEPPVPHPLAVDVVCGGPSISGRMRRSVEALRLTAGPAPQSPAAPDPATDPASGPTPVPAPLPAPSTPTPYEPTPKASSAMAESAATPDDRPEPAVPPIPAPLPPLPALAPLATPAAVTTPTAVTTQAAVTATAAPVASAAPTALPPLRLPATGTATAPITVARGQTVVGFRGVPLSQLVPAAAPAGGLGFPGPGSDAVVGWLPEAPPGEVGPIVVDRERPPGVVWDEQDLLTFATGRIADVFGPDFADIDDLGKRVRLPEPPYLLSSRVVDLQATPGALEPARLSSEYDIAPDAWYLLDGMVPAAITIEAGQCDMMLVSYLGIDRHNRGERVYRLLDSTLTFHGDLPQAGQTLRYDISIDRFVSHGDVRLFFFSYRCYADGELILELSDACAGFFTQEELDASGGIVTPTIAKRQTVTRRASFKPLLRTDATRLEPADIAALGEGRVADVFGPQYDQGGLNPSLRLPDNRLRMIDEIPRLDRLGGEHGLGHLTAVKYLDPEGWYFRCHFTDDPVLAGSLVAEGGVQILQAFALSLGLQTVLPDARFQTVPGLQTQVKVRGQITPVTPSLRYEVEVTDITLLPRPTLIADITVYDGERAVISMRNFGVQLREKPGTPYRPDAGGVTRDLGRRNAAGEVAVINELHLAHAAKGNLATAMGPEFEIYENLRAPHIPNGDFQFVDRIMVLEGTRGDLRAGAVMETEYDAPPEAWYFADNNAPSMPNCVLLETSLQAAILLGYYLGATLDEPTTEYSIRNLDGTATLLRHVDLRGRTIRQRTTMLSSSAVRGTVLQNFRYELSVDGEPFYRGESLFGYFTKEALASQAGLDNGSYVAPWIDQQPGPVPGLRTLDLASDPSWFLDGSGGGMRLPDGQLRLLDRAEVVADGGRHGAGYLRGHRRVTPEDWYFTCHFHRDPVMPGSLGVESVLEGLQLFALSQNLQAGMTSPRFAMARDVPVRWRYRGQILRTDPELQYEIHVKEVRREAGRVLVIGDASLYKPGLRIYELLDIAVELVDEN